MSRRAVEEGAAGPANGRGADDQPDGTAADSPETSPERAGETRQAPDLILWAALSIAPEDGITVGELMAETGMSRPWVYQRLRDLALRGQVTQASRGRWRPVTGHAQ